MKVRLNIDGTSPDDEKIVQLLYERDEGALQAVSDLYGARLTKQAQSFLGNPQDAAECVNDVLFKLWNTVPPHKPGNLFLYLLRLCRFTAFDMIDKREALKRTAVLVELTHELQDTIPSEPEFEADSDETFAEHLNSFLSSLSREKRIIFIKRYWYEESIAEIASDLNLSQSKVKTKLSRLRSSFRKLLERKGYHHD